MQRDLVDEFAPWAKAFITDRPLFDAISCNTSEKEGVALHGHAVHAMNHWLASVDTGNREQVAAELVESFGHGET